MLYIVLVYNKYAVFQGHLPSHKHEWRQNVSLISGISRKGGSEAFKALCCSSSVVLKDREIRAGQNSLRLRSQSKWTVRKKLDSDIDFYLADGTRLLEEATLIGICNLLEIIRHVSLSFSFIKSCYLKISLKSVQPFRVYREHIYMQF